MRLTTKTMTMTLMTMMMVIVIVMMVTVTMCELLTKEVGGLQELLLLLCHQSLKGFDLVDDNNDHDDNGNDNSNTSGQQLQQRV